MPSSRNGVLRGQAASAVSAYRQPSVLTGSPVAHGSDGTRKPQVRLAEVYTEEIARLREQARAEGYAAGHAEGLRAGESALLQAQVEVEQRMVEAQAAWESQVSCALAALASAVDRLDAQTAPVLGDLTQAISEGAFMLVEDLLGRELAVAHDPGRDAIERALSVCGTDAPVVVRVHPEDHAVLSEKWLAQLPGTVTVRPDAGVERCGAIAEAGSRRVDAQVGAALARVRSVLQS